MSKAEIIKSLDELMQRLISLEKTKVHLLVASATISNIPAA